MNFINKRYMYLFFGILIAVMIAAYVLNVILPDKYNKPLHFGYEELQSSYTTIKDARGKIILQTGLPVHCNDEYINENNQHYKITKVKGNEGIAELISSSQSRNGNSSAALISAFFSNFNPSIPVQAATIHRIAIYHTHSDESFTPTSGSASQSGNGDVYKVGNSLADSLSMAGITVTHSYAKHDPHDINAYHRSRRTVAQLLKEQPDAAFDVHRDSAPLNAYRTSVNSIDVARVMIVIGRSNPNMQTNLNYAQAIKDKADALHPGLMRGIFMGKGDYNQDLYPTALLFEIGTETNSLPMAQKAANLLTDAILGVTFSK